MTCQGAFARAIREARAAGRAPIIADIKAASPKEGHLLRARTPAQVAQSLERAGACALSVVTEAENFGGSAEGLRQVAAASSLPVLRKDFFSAVEQVDESRSLGAAAILLILATIPDSLLGALYARAQALGLDAVFEVHTAAQLERALRFEPRIVGINNRDILQLETDAGDVKVTEALAPLVPDGVLVISESSIGSAREVKRALAAGADAVLVGTAILKAEDPAVGLRSLVPEGGTG